MKLMIKELLLLLLPFCILIFVSISIPVTGYAQEADQCTEQLSKAENEYQAGKWNEAINLINQCLQKKNVSEQERGVAYRLLGLIYIAIQLEKEANDAVRNLLIMVPNYKVDPDNDPPQFKKIVEDISDSLNPRITSINPAGAEEGGDPFLLKVQGINFVYGSVIKLNGTNMLTDYINSTELQAQISSKEIPIAGEYELYVYSPIMGGRSSNILKLSVESSGKFPWTWIAVGGGVVVAAVVAILTLGGDDEESQKTLLANPPARP